MLLNLAGNAIKFTERGGVSLIVEPCEDGATASALPCATPASASRREHQERIFQDFEQADGSSTRRYGGTGLGLAISKRIVEALGGSIELFSKPGEGSTFFFTLPLPAAQAGTCRPSAAPDLTDAAVLIVAASAIEPALIARRLARWGATIVHRARMK